MARSTALVIATACAIAVPARVTGAQQLTLFDGKSLKGWKTQEARPNVDSGVLTLHGASGWVRTERVWGDFVLTLEMRLLNQDSSASVFVRAWPTFDRKTKAPNNAYSVNLGNQNAPPDEAPAWSRLEITCAGSTLTVRVDDRVVHTNSAVDNPQGHVALGVQRGAAEFRRIELRSSPSPFGDRMAREAEVFKPDDAGVTMPKARLEVKPRYTAEAMQAQVSGAVLLSAVVLPDGTVGRIRILRSLDPKLGLDVEAIKAARQWRFVPGTKDGEYVAVEVTIELSFLLK